MVKDTYQAINGMLNFSRRPSLKLNKVCNKGPLRLSSGWAFFACTQYIDLGEFALYT